MAQAAQPSNAAVQRQQAQQQALTGMLGTALLSAWALIDLHDLAGTLPKYQQAVTALVAKFGQGSAVIAAKFYRDERAAAGVAGKFLPPPAATASPEQVQASVSWATKGLWTPQKTSGPTASPDVIKTEPLELPGHVKDAQTLVRGAAQKMVVDTGRNTLLEAIEKDNKARGWAREARPGACSFCALLSTRGAVYKSEETASFEAHDHCHCIPVPVFSQHYEPPAHVRQFNQIYIDSTRGKHNADARNAFRVALAAHRAGVAAPEPAHV